MKDNILITGSHGFIGSRIKGGKKLVGDISTYLVVKIQARYVKGIVHLAAKSNNRMCEDNERETVLSNLLGLCNVLEVALAEKIWVLFISTHQVGDSTFYGLSKLMGEELCRLFQKRGLKVSILRLPIVYGENDKQDKIVTKFINQLKQGIEPKIETDNPFYFAYVDDVIKVIEDEVHVLTWGRITGKQYLLTELSDGIKKCLERENNNDR